MSHLEMGSQIEGDVRKKVNQRFFIQKLESPENFVPTFPNENCHDFKYKENALTQPLEVVSEFWNSDEKTLTRKLNHESETESISPGSDQCHAFNIGRWTENEHKKFLEAILLYGNEWKKVQQYISTRSSTQARSHAQKFFLRLKKSINNSGGFDEEHLQFFRALGENKKSNFI